MNDVKTTPADVTADVTETTKRVWASLLATLTDLGSAWAAYGLKVGKMALTTSSETLGKLAHTLDTLAVELEKRAAAAEAQAAAPGHVDAPAS